mgnify:FL=1
MLFRSLQEIPGTPARPGLRISKFGMDTQGVNSWLKCMQYKLLRFVTSLLPIADNRHGSCNRCGQCCKLPNPCKFLRYDENGLSSCAVYRWRPPSCRKYPRTARENLTQQTCGYYFAEAKQPASFAMSLGAGNTFVIPEPKRSNYRRTIGPKSTSKDGDDRQPISST